VLLVVKCTCAVLKDVTFHLEGNIFHGPEGVAKSFINDGEQVLGVCVVSSFGVGVSKLVAGVHVGLQVVVQIGQVFEIGGWVVVGILALWSLMGKPRDVRERVPIWA